MAIDNLILEVSPPLLEAMGISGSSGKLDYFTFLGVDPERLDPEEVRRAVMTRSRELRPWQNSPQHGPETQKLLPMLHRIAAIVKDPLRRDAYRKELQKRVSGQAVNPIEEFQDMVRAALADGKIDQASKAELLRYASTHNVPLDQAGRIIKEIGASATFQGESTAEIQRQWEFTLNEREMGLDAFACAVNVMREKGGLTANSGAKMLADAEKFSITRGEAAQIISDAAAKAFRTLVESVARDGVLNNNQARLLMPKAATFGLSEARAYQVLSDYTFTGASQEDIATLHLSAPAFDSSEIEDLLAKQKTVHYVRRFDALHRLGSSLSGVGIALLVIALIGGVGYVAVELVPGLASRSGPAPISRPAAEIRNSLPDTAASSNAVAAVVPQSTPVPAAPSRPSSFVVAVASENPNDPPSFQVKATEVTCSEYQKFLLDILYPTLPAGWGADFSFPAGSAEQPVGGVRWQDAIEYCKWQAGKLKLPVGQVRLMTVAEYKRLLRAPIPGGRLATEASFWSTSPLVHIKDVAAIRKHSLVDALVVADGQVYDLLGNVAEWGMDEQNGERVILGGDYALGEKNFDLATPRYRDPQKGYPEVGFRYVISGTDQ